MHLTSVSRNWNCTLKVHVLRLSIQPCRLVGLWQVVLMPRKNFFQTHTSFFNELKYFSDTSSGIPWTNADGWWKRTITKIDNWKVSNAEKGHTVPWKGYPSKCFNIPGNFCCPLGRFILWGLLQVIVQVTHDAHRKKPKDVKLHPVFGLKCKHTGNIRITKLPATFAANPEPPLTTCQIKIHFLTSL